MCPVTSHEGAWETCKGARCAWWNHVRAECVVLTWTLGLARVEYLLGVSLDEMRKARGINVVE